MAKIAPENPVTSAIDEALRANDDWMVANEHPVRATKIRLLLAEAREYASFAIPRDKF